MGYPLHNHVCHFCCSAHLPTVRVDEAVRNHGGRDLFLGNVPAVFRPFLLYGDRGEQFQGYDNGYAADAGPGRPLRLLLFLLSLLPCAILQVHRK